MNAKTTVSSDTYYIVRMIQLPLDNIQTYWQLLYMHGYLDYRLCDVDNPTWEDVKEMIQRMGNTMFAIVDRNANILGEFMLENFTGAAAQVHFSASPQITPSQTVQVGKWAVGEILQSWNIKTLFGLTPVTNRAARIYNLKLGFRRVGILPSGIRDRGQVVDGLIMVKEA